jgi:Na+/H+-translocating membrane pyrophosphatase
MIVVGQRLAAFMSNAGDAWDNAKDAAEDEPRTETTGKGSEKYKAAVTGDNVGDPLADLKRTRAPRSLASRGARSVIATGPPPPR